MEESKEKLKVFFEQIYQAEAKADQYKTKLFTTPGGKREVFQAIDKKFSSQISSDDICCFCQQQGIQITEKTSQIIGRYFRNWNQPITYEQFSEVLTPKIEDTFVEDLPFEEPVFVFLELINTILNSFKILQLTRESILQHNYCIIKHFQQNYGSKKFLTKQDLKQFMMNQDCYTRNKFAQISNYIFGNVQSKISWSHFFFNKEKSVKIIQTQKNIKQEEEKTQREKTQRQKSIGHMKKSCKNIEQVLNQIQQIEKNMKYKKEKHQRQEKKQNLQKLDTLSKSRLKQSRLKQSRVEPQTPKRKVNFVGKVVSANTSQKSIKNENSNIRFSEYNEKQEIYDEMPICMKKPNMSSKLKQFSLNKNSKHLRKNLSQAQLKIEEIERRAMDKYLNSRKSQYLPNDGYVPYFHVETRESQQFARLRKRENYESGRLDHQLFSRMQSPRAHIYSRNKISRPLYNTTYDSSRPFRQVSPRLLRY